ncbi:hypothetical protein PRIPAC_86107, partial [Pristionchus pacificus]|uniref:Uncharacterized protein n=1 Tax=Pristionchus pacificus TaxID=54126 RepID=A0A2A6BK90_PRIPA
SDSMRLRPTLPPLSNDSIPSTTPMTTFVSLDDSRDRLLNALWCPLRQFGTQCPDPTLISYYSCCGELNNRCCSHLRLYILILIFSLPLLLLVPLIGVLARRAKKALGRRQDAVTQTKYRRGLVLIDQTIEETIEPNEELMELR